MLSIAFGQKRRHISITVGILVQNTVREFCVNELCIVMHGAANQATGAPVTY